MARHTRIRRRNTGKGRSLHRGVTIFAGNSQFSRMVQMTERDLLETRFVDIGGVSCVVECNSGNCYSGEGHQRENNARSRNDLRTGMEYLSHSFSFKPKSRPHLALAQSKGGSIDKKVTEGKNQRNLADFLNISNNEIPERVPTNANSMTSGSMQKSVSIYHSADYGMAGHDACNLNPKRTIFARLRVEVWTQTGATAFEKGGE